MTKRIWGFGGEWQRGRDCPAVFDLYLMAVGSTRIAKLLDYLGVPTVTGGTWEGGTIGGMIVNEKYKGISFYRNIIRRQTSGMLHGKTVGKYKAINFRKP